MKRNFTKILAAFALLVGLTIPMGVWGQTKSEANLHYTGSTTFTWVANTNYANQLNLSETVWSVTGQKNDANNMTACNKDGSIRLYPQNGNGSSITVTNLYNATIESISFTMQLNTPTVKVDGTIIEPDDGGVYTINSSSFVVINGIDATSGNQVQISSIAILYSGGTTPSSYTLTYNANGGTGTMTDANSPYDAGATVTVLGNEFTRTGYDFDHWNTAADDSGTSYDEDDTFTINANTTLYAQWTENTTPGGDEQWVLTNLADLTENDVFVIVGNGYAMTNNNGTSSAPATSAVTIENDMITSNVASTIQWTVSGNATDGYTFHPNGSTTTWLYCNTTASSGSNNNMRVGTGNRKVFELTTKSNKDYLVTKDNNVARYVCVYSNSDWRGYVESSIVATNTTFYKKVTGGTVPPSISANNVSLEYNAESGSIAYTINNSVEGGTLTANTQSDWLTLGQVGETVPFACTVNEAGTAREGVVTLTYTYGDNQTVTKDVTVTQAGNPNAVMTIADVRAQGTGSVATKGVVTSCFGTTGYIQDATAAICVYGNSLNVGDEIRVSGTLTTYHGLLEITDPQITVLSNGNTVSPTPKTIAEINADDYTLPTSIQGLYVTIEEATVTAINGQNTTIAQGENTIVVRGIYSNVSYNVNDVLTLDGNIGCYDAAQIANPQNVQVQAAPSITFDPDVVDLDAAQHLTLQVPFTYENLEIENYESFAVQFYDTNDEPTTKPDWIFSASVTGTNDEGYNVTLNVISANEGEARSCYFKVYVGETYSNLVTINQAAYVAPFAPVNYTKASVIVSGNHYIIVGVNENDTFVMGEQKPNNRSGVLVSADGNTITVTSEEVYDFVIESSGDNYTIYDARTPGYLYAASSNSNHLKTQKTNDDNGVWAIGFDADSNEATVVAQGNNTRKYMRFNYNLGNPVFSCYPENSSVQTKVYFYEKSNVVPSSYTLDVTGYGNNAGGYKLIASPVTSVTPSANNGFIASEAEEYDLYAFDENEELEWRNYKDGKFNLVSGKGYLYANKNNVTLTFAGTAYTGDGQVPVVAGYNLVGNPYAVAANLSVSYYRLNASGSEVSASTESSVVNAMEGVFVQATEAGSVTFTTSNSGNGKSNAVVMNLSRNRGTVIDNAIVRFDEGQQLPKFQLFENSTKLYIPQGNKDYAIVRSAAQGEMPVSFRASENGTYTIAVEAENVDMNYLHLIDNMTGADVDLLATPNYTFEARTNDYTSRFRLVFSAEENGASTGSATFAFFNGTSWTVSNTGDATLQVVDITGRIVSSETINGNATVSLNQPAGIYMLRLVNGNDVKVQKVVVR